jgi:DNA-binding NarL/FixJ family response regulator
MRMGLIGVLLETQGERMFTRVKDQQRGAARGSRDRRIRVMLVDDDEPFLKNARRILDDRPELEVVATAPNGETAVELARERKPDVVLMDVQMEGMSGTEATRLICAELPDVRVVGLSGHADRESVGGLLKAGAIGYLLKPCHPTELIKAVCEAAANRTGDAIEVYYSPNSLQWYKYDAFGTGSYSPSGCSALSAYNYSGFNMLVYNR